MAEQISPELVERMAAYVRKWGVRYDTSPLEPTTDEWCAILREGNAIAVLLPKPVDPDLVEARELAEKFGWYTANLLPMLRAGTCDDSTIMRNLLAAIKRGRELERGQ